MGCRMLAAVASLALALVAAPAARATFPGANGMLTYSGTCSDGVRSIDPDGANDAEIFSPYEHEMFTTANFSPDGNQMVFAKLINPTGALYDYDLYVQDLRTGAIRPVVQNPAQESWAAWAPDGTHIAFESNRDTPPGAWQNEVYIVDLATGAQTRLTHNLAYDGALTWAPDGRSIVVEQGGTRADLVRVDVPSGQETNLTATNDFDEGSPTYAPDGSRIAFTRSPGGFRDIYSMASTGGDLKQLTTDGDDDRFPVWSPDGTRIAFSRGYGPLVNLVSMAAAGGDERFLTRHTLPTDSHFRDCLIDWQPCVAGVTVRCHSQAAALVPIPTPPATPAPAAKDRTPPRLRIRHAATRRHRHTVVLTLRCSEACVVRLRAPGRSGYASRSLIANTDGKLTLRLRSRAPRRTRIAGVVRDAAGNRRTVKVTVLLR